jgi:putative MFS transporter
MSNVSIAARLDRLPITRFHKKATVLIGIGLFFDLYDIFLTGVLSTVLSEQFHVAHELLPLLLGAGFLGMFIGAIVLNGLADRFGRKKAFMWNLAIYSGFTLLAAFSPSTVLLIVFRILAGFGLGAEPPLCDTYLSELLPVSKRGKYVAWAYTLAFLSVPVEGFLAKWFAGCLSSAPSVRSSFGFCGGICPNPRAGWKRRDGLRKRIKSLSNSKRKRRK